MARKYTRDNRGRFASTGATARGGRLRTASGGKRERQTMKAAGAGGSGVMKGAVKRDLGAMAKASKPAAPKAPAKTARKAPATINDAKAARIVSRVDGLRPAMRQSSGSVRRTQNSIKTYKAAGDFLLGPSRRAMKKGEALSVNESVRKAVGNARKNSRRK